MTYGRTRGYGRGRLGGGTKVFWPSTGGPGTYGGSAYGTVPYGGGTGNQTSPLTFAELAGTATVNLSGSGNLTLLTLISGTAVVTLSGTANLKALLPLTTTHADPSQMAKVNFTAYGMLDVDVPVVPPPPTVSVSKFKRNSITMPAPVLSSKGLPT